MNNYASGELTPGRWYKDNTGNEYRFIGEASSDNGVGLFNSGEGVVKKSYNDFEPNVKETKMFKWFKDGGETKQVIKLEPITTKRNKQGFRFYSTNDGNTIYAEKNGKIHNVSEDSLNVLGEVPLRRSRFEFVGIISDEDTKNLYPLHYEYKTMAKVKDKFQMAEGGEVEIGDYVKIKENYGGGSGTVEDIMNNFVIVKTKEGKKSFHKSDLIPYSSASEAAYDLGDEGDPDYEDFEDDYAEGGIINFDEIRSKLDKYGYNFSSPYGTNRIDIKGYGKGGNKYFNAKKAKAISVVNDLKHIGIDAKYKLSGDGFYDIYISEDGQYAKGGELDKITFSIDSEELDETLHNTFESQLEYNDKNGDVLYTLPKRQFDRLIDLADSKGFDVDYENSEDSVIIVYNDYANGGFVEKTDEELKGMNDDELFEYLDAKAAYMKQYTRPLSAYKAKNFAANATAVQYQKEGTAKLDDNFPNIEKINKQAEQDYQQGLKKIVEKRNKMADGGEIKLKETYKYIGDESLFTPLRNGRNTTSLKKGDVVKVTKIGADGKEDAIVANFDGDAILLSKEKLQDSNSFEKTMSKGGETKFADKVNSIKKKLLANKKVPKSVQKDYGKTYNKAEAKESAQRIVGSMLKKKMAKGGINSGKTPAPLKDRIYGSKKNKAGSASSKTSAQKIELNETILETLKNKAKEYNDKHSKKVSTNALKAVMRRGMGAYSSSHRPTITGGAPNSRQAWGYARVNKFLKKKSGQKVKAAYVQDDDLM